MEETKTKDTTQNQNTTSEIVEFNGEVPRTIYTIGTENTGIPLFINALVYYQVHAVIDIRPEPEKDTEPYQPEQLKQLLKKYNIYYRRYPEFTKRPILMGTLETQNQLDILEKAIHKGYWFCFLGKEKYPNTCPRQTQIGQYFHKKGYRVIHLIPMESITDAKTQTVKHRWKYYQYHEEARAYAHNKRIRGY